MKAIIILLLATIISEYYEAIKEETDQQPTFDGFYRWLVIKD